MIRKTEYKASFLLLVVGLLLSLSFFLNIVYTNISKNWIEVKAYVTSYELLEKGHYSIKSGYKVSDKYKINITYFIKETKYNSSTIISNKPDNTIFIKYNPSNPEDFQINGNNKKGFPVVITFTGIVLIIAGFVLLIQSFIRSFIKNSNSSNNYTK